MDEWQLRLTGNMAELDRLVSELEEPALAVKRDVRGFYVTSAVFGTDDKANPTAASVSALIAKLNGLVQVLFGGHAAITVAGLEFARDDGTRIAIGVHGSHRCTKRPRCWPRCRASQRRAGSATTISCWSLDRSHRERR